MDNEFKFLTSDQQIIIAPYAIKKVFGILDNIKNNIDNNENKDNLIKLEDIKSDQLKLILDYCHYYDYNPKIITYPINKEELTEFDIEIIKSLSFDKAIYLIIVANKLKCPAFVSLCNVSIALSIKSI